MITLAAQDALTWSQFLILIAGMFAMFLVVGIGLLYRARKANDEVPVVRGWLAACLVLGLLTLTGATLCLTGVTELQSLLFGGVVASAGTAVAFYFASRGNETTQQNLLNAAFNTVKQAVPAVKGESLGQAQADIQKAGFVFAKDSKIHAADQVDHCAPPIGSMQPVGTTVTVFK